MSDIEKERRGNRIAHGILTLGLTEVFGAISNAVNETRYYGGAMLMGEFNAKPEFEHSDSKFTNRWTDNYRNGDKPDIQQIPFITPHVYWLSENRGSATNMASLYVCQPYVMDPIGTYNSFKAIKYNVAEDSPPIIKIRLINTVRESPSNYYNLKGGNIQVLTNIFKVTIETCTFENTSQTIKSLSSGTSSSFDPSIELQKHIVSSTDTRLYGAYGDQNKNITFNYTRTKYTGTPPSTPS